MFIDYTKFRETLVILIKNKDREVIDILLSGIKIKNYIDWANDFGFTELIQWMFENDYECTKYIDMDTTAKNGQLNIMRWLYDNNKATFTDNTMKYAAKRGDLDMIKFLHGKVEYKTDAMDWAAAGSHLKALKWLHQNGYKCTTRAMDYAAQNGYLKIVKWLHNIGYKCTSKAIDSAIINGEYDTLEWLHNNTHVTCSKNILNGSKLEPKIIKWLEKNEPELYEEYQKIHNI